MLGANERSEERCRRVRGATPIGLTRGDERRIDAPPSAGGSGAAIRSVLLANESHTKGGISAMAKKAAKGGKKKGGKKR